jgi:hypothetical protein
VLPYALKKRLTHTVYVAPALSVTPTGEVIHGDPVPHAARCDPSHTIVMGSNGEDDLTEWAIILEEPIGRKDLVWPMGKDPRDKTQGGIPKRVEPLYNIEGALSHYEVLL